MIQLDGLAKSFGDRTLFRDLNLTLSQGQRLGLIGPNGAGKTTLFRILAGEAKADEGRVVLPRGAKVGYLPQDVGDLGDTPILDVVLSGRPALLEAEVAIAGVEHELAQASGEEATRLADTLGALHETLLTHGGFGARAEAAAILSGLGFARALHHEPARVFSGGWRMRVLLARLLFARPDLLLLDEPTNHLDLPSIEWLEETLSRYEGTVVLISHDRAFLNRLVDSIAAFDTDGFHLHRGNYDAWEASREERRARLEAAALQQAKTQRETQAWIDRFRSKASKAKQVQARVKALEKEQRVVALDESKAMRLTFPEAAPSGKWVIEAATLSVGWAERVVLRDVSFTIQRGERVALVGPNGAGKTTLLRALAGQIPIMSGEVRLGHNVVSNFFAQHSSESLNPANTILQEMERAATLETFPACRSILGAFLFSGDAIEKPVRVLSGGERNRVALARMLLTASNVLLLDEPTNHLDMASRQVLLEALQRFSGTVLFVSHDRYFVTELATKVLHIEEGVCAVYPGDYPYYQFKRREAQTHQDAEGAGGAAVGGARREGDGALHSRRDKRRAEADRRRAWKERFGALEAEVAQLEASIEASEASIASWEQVLARPDLYATAEGIAAARDAQGALAVERRNLDSVLESWERAAAALEEARIEWAAAEEEG